MQRCLRLTRIFIFQLRELKSKFGGCEEILKVKKEQGGPLSAGPTEK